MKKGQKKLLWSAAIILVFSLLIIPKVSAAKDKKSTVKEKQEQFENCLSKYMPSATEGNTGGTMTNMASPQKLQATLRCIASSSNYLIAFIIMLLVVYIWVEPVVRNLEKTPTLIGMDLIGLILSGLIALVVWGMAWMRMVFFWIVSLGSFVVVVVVLFMFFAQGCQAVGHPYLGFFKTLPIRETKRTWAGLHHLP